MVYYLWYYTIVKNVAYAGLVYYEKKEAEDLVTFAVAKDLNALLEVKIFYYYMKH